ncbi:MAG: hypothetical protein OEU36_24880 [Gammaproteobacteria bacterium]|nr:hypothetical protein [Gammaproteobacteria bacterium]
MIRNLLAILMLGILFAGCTTRHPPPEQKTVQGVMKHVPANVRSSQAWQGHQFMVGSTPVIPTAAVPEKELEWHVGKSVVVSGIWDAGQEWWPTEEEKNMPMPVYPDEQIIIRGEGLKVSSIQLSK